MNSRPGSTVSSATAPVAAAAEPDATSEPEPAAPGPERPAPDPAAAAIVGGALADYDTLSASQVVRRLESLGPEELDAVRRYEGSTRNRRTILNRAGQLLEEQSSGPSGGLAAMELARLARPEDRQACTRLLSQALVAAESMRGGAALVGDATTVSLLDRWTQPGDGTQLLVGEYEGAVVGLLAVTAAPGPRGVTTGLIALLLRGDGAPGASAWARRSWTLPWPGVPRRAVAWWTPWRSPGTAPPNSAWRGRASRPAS